MEKRKLSNLILPIIVIYLICYLFRIAEYMLIRTDQSILGEAFLHKLAGILVLALAMRYFSFQWQETGFSGRAPIKYIFYGLLLGISMYVIAYGTEFFIQYFGGQSPSLQLYVTSYSVDGNIGNQTGLLFFILCILGNIINVTMEEGIFRGLFLRLAETKYTFLKAVILSSLLFGLWHIMAPLRSLLDGKTSAAGVVMYALMLVITSGLAGVKFCLLTKITGSLWMPMADHFVNNTIVNILHVATSSGADEMQIIRIVVAQTVSFLAVLCIYRISGAHQKRTFRV